MDVSEDVFFEILLRFPPKSVFKFRCLSKRSNQIINDSFFLRSYAEQRKGRGRLLAFILNQNRESSPTTRIAPLSGNQVGTIPKKYGIFICSSDSLVLCVGCNSDSTIKNPAYHVGNLLTKKWVSLPSPPDPKVNVSIALACQETSSQLVTNYKVVQFTDVASNGAFMIETYSSKTGMWTKSKVFSTASSFWWVFVLGRPLALNGIIHWPVANHFIAVYDPYDIGGENHLQIIQKPVADARICSSVLTRSSDGILWCGVTTCLNMTRIWTLPKGENGYRRPHTIPSEEWSLVYTMDFDFLGNDCSMTSYERKYMKDYNGIRMIALCPWNPLVVYFLISDTIFLYNTESRIMERVQYDGKPITDPFYMNPYFESRFLSSYALQ
ncbi:unnamed protein product [Fraxinus pennsylvanica]|uniref:F-box domain-containing protein n=1 Tax=Fraxinus pennsylvanica TaxID=56036 RepID=A0AAD1ZC60_9LAMI|nr:unnamed protein product [Fraxinus pennsylvanica]